MQLLILKRLEVRALDFVGAGVVLSIYYIKIESEKPLVVLERCGAEQWAELLGELILLEERMADLFVWHCTMYASPMEV